MTPDQRRAVATRLLTDAPEDAVIHHLHVIANGPIMDPSRIYLPAGRISQAEAEKREQDGVEIVSRGGSA